MNYDPSYRHPTIEYASAEMRAAPDPARAAYFLARTASRSKLNPFAARDRRDRERLERLRVEIEAISSDFQTR